MWMDAVQTVERGSLETGERVRETVGRVGWGEHWTEAVVGELDPT